VSGPANVIRLDGVLKRYDGKTALEPTTLAVARGECVALIGPSGCGKSTILRLIVGLVPADGGAVWLDDLRVAPDTVDAVRGRLGYVIQEGGLFPHLTAAENAAVRARDLGWRAERVRARLEELRALVGLPADLLDRYPAQLSGGQRQRVGLMRALMLDPEAILLDEPLGALDPMIRTRLQVDLKRIFRTLGKTVLLVTHDLDEAAYLADRIALMREGRVLQVGPFGELRDRPADPFVTEFVRAQRPPAPAETGS
jgi:osmoprotectant transport system ATP-binding protein